MACQLLQTASSVPNVRVWSNNILASCGQFDTRPGEVCYYPPPKAVFFDGYLDSIALPQLSLPGPTGAFTIEAWVFIVVRYQSWN